MENDGNQITVVIYTAVPGAEQFRRALYPWRSRFKSNAKNGLNVLATKITGKLFLDGYAYKVAKGLGDNSNRGDIAIRMAVRAQLAEAFAPRALKFIEIGWGHLNADAVAHINESCDLFVISGGGYIFLDGDGTGGARFADVPFLRMLRCPIVSFGIGLNRLMHEQTCSLDALPRDTREQIRSFAAACRAVTVRDRDTLELFQRYGEGPVILTGDPVLYFGENPTERSNRERRRLTIGVNLAAHGWRSLSVLKPLLPQIVDFLMEVQVQQDAEFIYLMHHDFERPIFSFLQGKGLRMRIVDGTAADLMSAYGDLDFVINQMLHSSIFAARAEVPFLNIAYDLKSVAFCSLLGIPECTLAGTELTSQALRGKFDILLEQRASLRERMATAKRNLYKAKNDFLEQLARSIVR